MKRRTRKNPLATARDLVDITSVDVGGGNARLVIGGIAGPEFTGYPASWSGLAKPAAAVMRDDIDALGKGDLMRTPYEHGAVGNGIADDTAAVQAAYDWLLTRGGGALALPRGSFRVTGNLVMETPGVSLIGWGGVITGGEVIVGPTTYVAGSGGVDFSGTCIRGVVFDRGDDYGATRQLVLRNVRGLDITDNRFQAAGKGICIDQADGNTKFHTVAMLNISRNRFGRLAFGIYGNSEEWDRFSDWSITDNFFNYCSDTSVWIAYTGVGSFKGGVDGLNFQGNTIFSQNYNSSTDPLFALKRYNLRLGMTNWLRIINNNFFEAGLSAVHLDTPQNFHFVGNHIAWPGQREQADCLEIHNGSPKGIIEGNTFALWTRAAIGLYDLSQLYQTEIGQNAWLWQPNPVSWKGSGSVTNSNSFRVFASGTTGYPVLRDFQVIGCYDSIRGATRLLSRDPKSSRGGVSGAYRRGAAVSSPTNVFNLSDIASVVNPGFGGLVSVMAINSADSTIIANYLLFVSSHSTGGNCTVLGSAGLTAGAAATHPSFTWAVVGSTASDRWLQATPVGSTAGSFNFDATFLGAVMGF